MTGTLVFSWGSDKEDIRNHEINDAEIRASMILYM